MTNNIEQDELYNALDKVSAYNKLGGRGHGSLEDNCHICGLSPSGLKQAISNYIDSQVEQKLRDAISMTKAADTSLSGELGRGLGAESLKANKGSK